MAQCPHCALSKMTQQISRLLPANKSTRSFHRVYIDWLDLDEGWDSYQGDGALVRRVMVAVCEATGMAMTYFTQSSKESENLPLVTDFVTFLALRYNLEVKVIRSDNELNRIKTRAWCKSVEISLELCAPDTHAQNGGAERFGRLIVEKTRAMRLSANLPHKLWREIIETAGYLYNRTPCHFNDWKSPYEAFHTFVFQQKGVSGPRKSQLHHLKAYGCKAYVLIKSKSDRPSKLRKLDARAHIGFLVGYKSTNIYRIWVPHKRKVIYVRDVIFNEDEVWDQKPIRLSPNKIHELDKAIEVVEVLQTDEQEDIQLAEDLDLPIPNPVTHQHDHEMENLEEAKQAEHDKLAWSQGQYPTLDPSESEFAQETAKINAFLTNLVENQRMTLKQDSAESSESAFTADLADSADSAESEVVWSDQAYSQPHDSQPPHHSYPHSQPHTEPYTEPYSNSETSETLNPEAYIEPSILDELRNQQNERFNDFRQNRILSRVHTTFAAGTHRRELPIEPVN